jgi:hypothetical protein
MNHILLDEMKLIAARRVVAVAARAVGFLPTLMFAAIAGTAAIDLRGRFTAYGKKRRRSSHRFSMMAQGQVPPA